MWVETLGLIFCRFLRREAQHSFRQPLRSQVQQLDSAAPDAGEVSAYCSSRPSPALTMSSDVCRCPSSGEPVSSPAAWRSTCTWWAVETRAATCPAWSPTTWRPTSGTTCRLCRSLWPPTREPCTTGRSTYRVRRRGMDMHSVIERYILGTTMSVRNLYYCRVI